MACQYIDPHEKGKIMPAFEALPAAGIDPQLATIVLMGLHPEAEGRAGDVPGP